MAKKEKWKGADAERCALARVFGIGAQMANICFNLKQLEGNTLNHHACACLRRCQVAWDEAVLEYRKASRRAKKTRKP